MTYTTLQSLFTGICDALRTKKNTTNLINHQDIPDEILNLPVKTNEYYVQDVSGATYNFTKASDGYWTRTNQSVNSSVSVCKVVFNMITDGTITFNCVNYAEANYDYGIIGKLDIPLSTGFVNSEYSTNSTLIAKHFRGSSMSTVQTYSMTVPAGEHYVYIKYTKDSSQNNNDDMFKFMISGAEEVEAPEVGVDVSGVTATASDVLMYKTFVNSSGELVEGTMGALAPADIVFTPNNDDARILTGNKYYTRDVNVSVSSYGSATPIRPTTSNKYVYSSSYADGGDDKFLKFVVVEGDSDLKAENIKSGVSIFGVTGTMESGSKVTSLSGTASTTSSGMGGWITYTNTITFNNTGFTTLPNNLWVMSNSNQFSGYTIGARWLNGSSNIEIYGTSWSSSSMTRSFDASTGAITLSISYTGTNYFSGGVTWSGYAW